MGDLKGFSIPPIDSEGARMAHERAEALLMPHRALGRLLELGEQLAGITGYPFPDLSRKMVVVMAGDHGVVQEGVSAYPAEVTGLMVRGFVTGHAGINVLSRHAGIDVQVVDMGCNADFQDLVAAGSIVDAKVARGTANMRREPAMSREQALLAVTRGAEIARKAAAAGYCMLGTGDMGIGNTTPSAAIAAVATGRPVRELTGRGTGVDDAGLARKQTVIEESIQERRPDPRDPLDILSKVGGFEIGGIAGLILGAAQSRIPVVIDGVISTAGAVIAWLMDQRVASYMFAAHRSVRAGPVRHAQHDAPGAHPGPGHAPGRGHRLRRGNADHRGWRQGDHPDGNVR